MELFDCNSFLHGLPACPVLFPLILPQELKCLYAESDHARLI